jgi:hypothetical protein
MPRDKQTTKDTDKASIQSSREVATLDPCQDQAPSNFILDAKTPSPVNEVELEQPPPPQEKKQDERIETLSKEYIDALFAGAPSFAITSPGGRPTPAATYPRNSEASLRDASDSTHPTHSALAAATLNQLSLDAQNADTPHVYRGYEVDVVEVPGWPSGCGSEPGSIGFSHFLELPHSDSLITEESQQSAPDFDSTEVARNRELMQTNPERIGIRYVNMDLICDRLVELQDLYDAFRETPENMTILNNQSPGDLYANLFSKFLTPPGYDGSTPDPTGLQVQILTLLRILNLKGIWYDFSLVEWRIKLGKVLFSDPDSLVNQESGPMWSERDILIFQITLSCELLLRLDAVVRMDVQDSEDHSRVRTEGLAAFNGLKSRKSDWDLVLARRFLENILVIKGNDAGATTPVPESRGLFSLLGGGTPGGTPKELPQPDIILLPQHQARQLSALVRFAEAIHWPHTDSILKEMATKLSIQDGTKEPSQPSSPSGWSFNPTTPSSISIYGTPLQTPRSTNNLLDGYFGQIKQTSLDRSISRNNSQTLRVPLSTTLSSPETTPESALKNIGGWLSRSFLTGLVLPGEAISHFLIATLLENDMLAMAALGDSANLYGGFVYAGRTWWSKSSIVGRVLACVEGSTEFMSWITFTKLPVGVTDGWHTIQSEQLPFEHPLRLTMDHDLVAQDSAIIPDGIPVPVKSEELTLPSDKEAVSASSIRFTQWDLTPLNPDLIDEDEDGTKTPTENELYTPSLTFENPNQAPHVLTLTYDVQFVTSWPCTSPTSTSSRSLQHVAKRSVTGTLSHSSSKRSISTRLSRRNSLGFEPLLSHPPEATEITPQPIQATMPEDEPSTTILKTKPVTAHPLHISYKYSIVSVADVLSPNFRLPFTTFTSTLPAASSSTLLKDDKAEDATVDNRKTVLVIDARDSKDTELLARAWCAEKGHHAIIGRVGRTCLACCIREARGIGINVVIRV